MEWGYGGLVAGEQKNCVECAGGVYAGVDGYRHSLLPERVFEDGGDVGLRAQLLCIRTEDGEDSINAGLLRDADGAGE